MDENKEKQCFRKKKILTSCPKGTPENVKCFVEKKIPVSCRKTRCVDGKLKHDDPKTGRKAGDSCKDAE